MIKGNLVPRIISVWEAVGLHHSWKPRLFLLVTATSVAVPFFYGDSVVFVLPTKVTSSPLNTVICSLGTHFWVFFGRETSGPREVHMSIQGDLLT